MQKSLTVSFTLLIMMWTSGNSPKQEKQSNKLGHEVCFINLHQHCGSNFICPLNDWDLSLWWCCLPLNPIHRFKSPDSSNQNSYLANYWPKLPSSLLIQALMRWNYCLWHGMHQQNEIHLQCTTGYWIEK